MLGSMTRVVPFSILALTVAAAPATASFHFMQVEQIIGGVGGDTTAQAIQLRMRFAGQNQVQQGRLVVRNAAGLNPIVICDMTTPVAQTAAGTRILIASASFISKTTAAPANATANFTMTALIPASYLAAGKLTFENDSGTQVLWSVAWGGAAYTGTNTGLTTNDADGNFGAPFLSALPSATTSALRFLNAFGALSTNNAADYASTAGAAVFNNSAGNSFTVNPLPPACPPDFNGDGTLDPDDLADYIGAFFAVPAGAAADFNGDGTVDPDDLADYIGAFFSGCG